MEKKYIITKDDNSTGDTQSFHISDFDYSDSNDNDYVLITPDLIRKEQPTFDMPIIINLYGEAKKLLGTYQRIKDPIKESDVIIYRKINED